MSGRRHRAAVACQTCRQRKVRCTVTVTGVPCVACTQDRVECVLRSTRGLGSPSHTSARLPIDRSLRHENPKVAIPRTPESSERRLPTSSTPSIRVASNGPSHHLVTTSTHASPPQLSQRLEPVGIEIPRRFSSDNARNEDEERLGAELASAALRPHSQRSGRVPFYTGDPGFTAALDVFSPERDVSRHVLGPSNTTISRPPEDEAYLRAKGCLTLPSEEICRELFRAYLQHVHTVLPIVDAEDIIMFQHDGPARQCSLLLLWSIFFVASNFVPSEIWRMAGFSSRKNMKEVMFFRAKCMYDIGYESDRAVQIQACLLMGFWHQGSEDNGQPLYWTGIAINLSHIMGFHRNPDAVKFNSSIPARKKALWRRIWWSCFFRDRWLGLTLGRPLRIHLNDCDVPLPSVSDVLCDLASIPPSIAQSYIPTDSTLLTEYWILLIQLSKLLGDALFLSYQPSGPRATFQQIEDLEAKVRQFKIPETCDFVKSPLVIFTFYHLHLHYQAFLITFYRPFITKPVINMPPFVSQEVWQAGIQTKVDTAASQTNIILDSLARQKLFSYAGPMTAPLLVPAMHIHLLACRSEDTLTRQLGRNKLDFCMLIQKEMQETYTVASIYRGIFSEAIRLLEADSEGNSAGRQINATDPSVLPPDDPAMENLLNGDFLGELMDEASFYNFWESMNKVQ